ncbi:MAG: acyl-CoA carboxylase subunit beta [Thermoleophilaceae bacterium]|nr:acyl-CoA carboxylase subunit beta [Thermoleophilaceae bacterium]
MKLAVVPEATDQVPASPPEAERIPARARLERLCDPGTLHVFRTQIASRSKRSAPGDGVVVGAGEVAGRPVFCYAQDGSFVGGSLGAAHGESIVRLLKMARDARAPVVSFVESAGARMDEGIAALDGYGKIFREQVFLSGRVPQISVITGPAAGGGAYSPALGDFVIMTTFSSMFLTGPGVVKEVTGEDVTGAELGGPRVQGRNGVCHLEAEDDADAIAMARELLGYLPSASGERCEEGVPCEPTVVDPGALVPSEARKVYDVKEVIRGLSDGSELLELAPKFARNLVTAFGRIDGQPVGFVASQARWLGGVLDATSAQKGARFVRTCNAFGLPLVVLVDTPGFLPGTGQEAAGVLRHGAKLLHAFAEARVPKITVILRKAYGGGFITMNSKSLGADLVLAWFGAEIGVVGAKQAVAIVNRRDIAAADDPVAERDRLAEQYTDERLKAEIAVAEGHVDELVTPEQTRGRLQWALRVLDGDHRHGYGRGNVPL